MVTPPIATILVFNFFAFLIIFFLAIYFTILVLVGKKAPKATYDELIKTAFFAKLNEL